MAHFATAFELRIALLSTWALLVLPGCDCLPEREPVAPFPPLEERLLFGEPRPHDGDTLTPRQRRRAAELIELARRYHPVWHPAFETEDDYYVRYHDDSKTKRWEALIRQKVENNGAWRACLAEIHEAVGKQVFVRDGNPPMFYIPSFQVVIHGNNVHGRFTMAFRISMLAPFYDYYEHARNLQARRLQMSVVPTRENAEVAERVRGIIAKHFPDHRELSPEVGSVRLPNTMIGNRSLGETVVADALFEDGRRW